MMCHQCIRAWHREREGDDIWRQLRAWQREVEAKQYRNRDTFDEEF